MRQVMVIVLGNKKEEVEKPHGLFEAGMNSCSFNEGLIQHIELLYEFYTSSTEGMDYVID